MTTIKQQKLFARTVGGRPLWHHLLAMGLILLCATGLFLWAGLVFLPDATDISRREIVNDDYSTLTAPLGKDGEIRQTLRAEGRLYGVVLNVATFNRVPHGTLSLRLEDAAGQTVASNDTDMTTLLDNTFHRFLFDGRVDAGNGADYTLVITAMPETGEDVLAFHRSDGRPENFVQEGEKTPHYPLENFRLTQDGKPVDGVLALQYTVRYAGSFIVGVFSFFAALFTVFLLALYLLAFVFRLPAHRLFLVAALVLGVVFMFLIPPRTAPDEYAHISTVYHYSNRLLGQAGQDTFEEISMRAGDEMKLDNYDFDATDIFAWQDIYENLFTRAPGGPPQMVPVRVVRVFPPLYTAPLVGVMAARLFGVGRVGLLMFGRLANLLFFAVVCSRAIKRMPLAKPMLLCAALLPMSLQLAASFSYDAYVIALSFYFIAYCLQHTLGKKKVGPRQALMLLALGLLLAPAKVVYLLVLPLLLFIPKANFPTKRFCVITRTVVLACALVMWMVFNSSSLSSSIGLPAGVLPENLPVGSDGLPLGDGTAPDGTMPPGIAANGDASQLFGVHYILGHLPQAIKVVLRTFWEQGPLWLQGLIGGRLGEIIAIKIEINWLFTIGLAAILFGAALPAGNDDRILSCKQRWSALGIFGAVAAAFILASLTWTPINYTTIFGVQGRYFLPVLPLALLAARGKNLAFKKPVWRPLVYACAVLVILCQLDAFLIILKR